MNSLRDPLDVLRSLDPAHDPALDLTLDPRGPRARAALEQILASPPRPSRPAARPRTVVPRLLVGATAVLVLGLGLVLVPPFLAGDPAYATWTAQPGPVGATELPGAAEACRDSQREGAGSTYGRQLAAAKPAVAERRGAWTLVLLAADDGFSALCVTDDSRPVFRSTFGYVGGGTATPGVRSLTASTLGVGSIDGHELSVATGPVGDDVTGLTFDSSRYGVVSATVSRGYFAFWLPGDDLEDAPRQGAPVEVTYRDGSTATRTLRLDG